jgi:uncharacterized protein (TIGR00251 family)
MKISIQVKTNSKTQSVTPQSDGSFVVKVHAPPVEGKANERIRELLSTHFNIPKSRIELVAGHKGKKKVFDLKEK